MSDLVSRLSETLDELERVATAATTGPWRHGDTWLDLGGITATVLSGEGNASELRAWLPTFENTPPTWQRNSWNDAVHIARWDPKAVLGLVAALRGILALYQRFQVEFQRRYASDPSTEPTDNFAQRVTLMKVVDDLALGFGISEEG